MKLPSVSLQGKPAWKIILRGAAIPGMIVATIVIIAAMYAVVTGSPIYETMKIGIIIGLFVSLFTGLEIILTILVSSKDFKTNSLLALGYLLVWVCCIYLILS